MKVTQENNLYVPKTGSLGLIPLNWISLYFNFSSHNYIYLKRKINPSFIMKMRGARNEIPQTLEIKNRRQVLTTQLMPYLCPGNSAICTALCGSEISQTRTFGIWPHSPVAKSLPSPASAREVTVFRQAFNTCVWLFRRGLNRTTVQL